MELLRKLFRRAPERRQHGRIYDRPLLLLIEGHEYKTLDWSMSGFRIAGFHREVRMLERFGGEIAAVGDEGRGSFTAEVARVADSNEIGARLLDISAAKFAALSKIRSQ